jgi:RsiW-degrading membrane proteinase PrsW (M82 family)
MTEPVYPPPPPPQAPFEPRQSGVHGPETHFFTSIRRDLTSLEQGQSPLAKSPKLGLILALILGATLSFLTAFLVQLPAVGIGIVPLSILVAPITEEPLKAASILIVALFMWKTIPNRRYGALLGASVGLGFAIAENILYSFLGNLSAEGIVSRWLSVPFMHVLWSAFVGIGIFTLLAQRRSNHNTPSWLPWILMLIGWSAHTAWNSLSVAISLAWGSTASAFAIMMIDVLLVFLPFAFVFRDFLGGHFNFFDFLSPVHESMPASTPPMAGPPSPPPPPPPPPM